MQRLSFVLAAAALLGRPAAAEDPLGKVLQLLDGLTKKIAGQGQKEADAYREYVDWCTDKSARLRNEIKTLGGQKARLEAQISEQKSNAAVATSRIDDLAADIHTNDADLKKAELIRKKEVADFVESERQLIDVVDTLARASAILERQMLKSGPSAQLDLSGLQALVQLVSRVADAAAFAGSDGQKLLALVQSQQASEDDEAEPGAPAADVYQSKSSGIADVIEDLKDKAEVQLADLRKAEVDAKYHYDMLKQSVSDQISADTKSMDHSKAGRSSSEEVEASAEGDLAVTVKQLAKSEDTLEKTKEGCMQTAADYEATTKGRDEELKVIRKAVEILRSSSSGAVQQTYSLVQVAARAGQAATQGRVGSKAVALVRQLARRHHSAALQQLASRAAAALRLGTSGGADPFAKVKGLVRDLIAQLEKEATAEAAEKAFCDAEIAKTEAKKSELDEDISKITAKIDQAAAKSASLKGEVQDLQAELAALAGQMAKNEKLRRETHGNYVEAKRTLEEGLGGVRRALAVLRNYYGAKEGASAALPEDDSARLGTMMRQPAAYDKAEGAGSSIIGILEVVESDFAQNLVKEETQEADSQAEYEKVKQDNTVVKAMKLKDVQYKVQESKALDKQIAEMSGDRDGMATEVAAVVEYYGKLQQRCIAKPEAYAERKSRRDEEIAGLKEALASLASEAALVQRDRQRRGHMRGSLAAGA